MQPKKMRGIVFAMIASSLVAGYYYFAVLRAPERSGQVQEAQDTGILQAVARIGDIVLSISGTGKLVPAITSDLHFSNSGMLVEMLTKVGDQVITGQVLARLQIDKSPAEHAAEIASTELAVTQAQQKLEELYANHQIYAAKAQLAFEEAQKALEDLNDFGLGQALAWQAVVDAREAVEEAELELAILIASPSPEAIYTAYASLLFKEKELEELQQQVVKIEHEIKVAPNSEVRNRLRQQLISLQARVAKQQLVVENAREKYETMDDPVDSQEMSVTETRLTTAQTQWFQVQQNWEEAQTGPKSSDLALAEAALVQAQADWERLKDGPNPDELALAQAELAEAQAKLAALQKEPLILDLVAPMDGIVASINAEEGDRVTDQTILTLIESRQLNVEVYLDENDLSLVQIGHQAEVIFEAIPDTTFNGNIVVVDPSLVQVNGASVVRALVQLETTPYGDREWLPAGFNATVTIISGQASDAVLIPLEAIHELDSGEYIVYVVHGDELERRQVETGLMDFTSVEVISGLAAGETVAVGEIGSLVGNP